MQKLVSIGVVFAHSEIQILNNPVLVLVDIKKTLSMLCTQDCQYLIYKVKHLFVSFIGKDRLD